MDHLPLEIVYNILREAAAAEEHDPKTLRYVYLSKSWARTATIVFYEHVSIDTSGKMERFKRFVMCTDLLSTATIPVGQMIQHLIIYDLFSDMFSDDMLATAASQFMAAVTIVLLHLPNLREFSNTITARWFCQLPHLVTLRKTCVDTLTHLYIVISRSDNGVFQTMNHLCRLQELKIEILGPWYDDEKEVWQHDPRYPLRLPTVKQFELSVEDDVTIPMLQFLSTCRIGTKAGFYMDMSDLESQHADLIIDFLTQNAITTVTLDSISVDVVDALAPTLVAMSQVAMHNTLAGLSLASHSVLPSRLILDSCIDRGESSPLHLGFWAFLLELQGKTAPLQRPCIIQIHYKLDLFYWVDREHDYHHAAFIGKLLPIAIQLLKHNIFVTDRYDVHCGSFTESVHAQ